MDDGIPPGEERFKLNVGTFLHHRATTLRLDGARRTHEFDLEDVLGLDGSGTTGYAEAVWRFAPRHRLGLRAFAMQRELQRELRASIELENRVLSVGTRLRLDSSLNLFTADYRYSFIKNPRMELAGIIGAMAGDYEFRFRATRPAVDLKKELTVPAPVVGASLDYFITPRWTASAFGKGIKLDLGSTDARVYGFGVSTEYMLTRHFGLGVGYIVDGVKLDLDRNNFRGRIGSRYHGVVGYLQARF